MAKTEATDMPDKWQAEDDLRTLCRAKEIKMDEKRHKAALKYGREKQKEIKEVLNDD